MHKLAGRVALLLLVGVLLISGMPQGFAEANGTYATTVSGTAGAGLRLRDAADLSAAILVVVPEGAAIEVIGEPYSSDGYAWYPVYYGGWEGWVAGQYLAGVGGAPAAAAATGGGGGGNARVSGTDGARLRIRSYYSLDAAIIGHAPAGATLWILDGPFTDGAGNSWYAVEYGGLSGYASAAYIATGGGGGARQSQAAPAPAPAAPASSGNGSIASVALQYQGYPYVWAGASPSGFDCSGFTMYVVQQVLGRNIGHSLGGQLGAGVAVDANSLAPGDLVFFQNTYQPGLSHVGIYIGGGQMIHAGSERTGVAISNIWDSYWAPKFYAARRL